MSKAIFLPISQCDLGVGVGVDGVWLHFRASTGKSASINVGSYAAQHGNIIGAALRDWSADRQKQADARINSDARKNFLEELHAFLSDQADAQYVGNAAPIGNEAMRLLVQLNELFPKA